MKSSISLVNQDSFKRRMVTNKMIKQRVQGVSICPMCQYGAQDNKDRCCHTGRRGDGHVPS